MDELQRKVDKYEAGLKHLLPKMRDMQKEKDKLQNDMKTIEQERNDLVAYSDGLNKEKNIVVEYSNGLEKERDDLVQHSECLQKKNIKLRLKNQHLKRQMKKLVDRKGKKKTKRLNESATKWKIRIHKFINPPDQTFDQMDVDGSAAWEKVGRYMAKEIHNLGPCVEEVALEMVKPLVDEYAEKCKKRMRLHLTTRKYCGWRVVVLGYSDTFGTELHLVPERDWARSRVWPCP